MPSGCIEEKKEEYAPVHIRNSKLFRENTLNNYNAPENTTYFHGKGEKVMK
jgi:hypothetical protein